MTTGRINQVTILTRPGGEARPDESRGIRIVVMVSELAHHPPRGTARPSGTWRDPEGVQIASPEIPGALPPQNHFGPVRA